VHPRDTDVADELCPRAREFSVLHVASSFR
jgi:hypothetical protein